MTQLRIQIHVGMHQARWAKEALDVVVRMIAGNHSTPRIEVMPLVCRAWVSLEKELKKAGLHDADVMLYIGQHGQRIQVSMRALGA